MATKHSLALLFAAATLAFSAAPALAQDTPVTLEAILEAVVEGNPALEAARLEADARSTHRDQVEALPDPTAGMTYQPFPILTARGSQRSQWRIEQMIPYPGKRRLQGDVAELGAAVARHEAGALEADLILEAKDAYFELYLTGKVTELTRAFQEELRGFEEAATVRYEVGQGLQQSILKAQLERNRLSQRLIELEARRRSAAETLARLTNAPGGVKHFDTAELSPPPVPEVQIDRLVEVSASERAEAAALDAAQARAAGQIALARKQFLPDFGVSVTYFDMASADMPSTANGRDAIAVGASVRLPLQRGRIRAQLQEAEIRARQIEARREALHVDIETHLQDLLFALEQERAVLDLYDETLLPQAASTMEATLSAYSTGSTDFIDLLDAERTIYAMRTGRVEAVHRYLKTAARLERELGIRSLEELDLLTVQREEIG
jgi:outer membrane protein TolC